MTGARGTGPGESDDCPDAALLVEFARGTLAPEEKSVVLAHVRACEECSEVLRLWTAGERASSELPSGERASSERAPREHASADRAAGGTGPMTGVFRPKASPPRPGDILDGKYKVERVLGLGGMGVVVAATHLSLGRTVAVKLKSSARSVPSRARTRVTCGGW